ncbi:glycyl radical protein [Desulfoscipio gibsoniae]|uniref:Pyruvate-formate lyase n=1 Tax=Desulfoscipio gibsoniae DSM 7213 TaxID=767817 RepID=R4KEI2_9FIRM|nr:pyruvate formate lyase family protein [Desulfoscipio gibsoniae]AGL00072.1 pyruvate-formate lyase [Desulfoscipio gibsoniae DSM 7213]
MSTENINQVRDQVLSERVKKEKEELLSAVPCIDTEYIEFMLDVYKENKTDPFIIRRAKLFNKLCSEKTLFIDNNPIIGTLTKYKYGSYPLFEEGCGWMKRTEEFALPRGKVKITPELRKYIDKGVEAWKDSTLFSMTRKLVSEIYDVDLRVFTRCGVWLEATPGSAAHGILPDYAKVLSKGLNGLLAEIEETEARLNTSELDGINKWYFCKAAKTTLNGMITLAGRYAALAREMAENEKDAVRKQELEEIADICQWVPANPARNFREAIQSFWFATLGVWMESPKGLNSPPTNFTKVLYPYYRKDKDEGRIVESEAIEMIQYYFLKINQLAYVLSPHAYRWNQSRLGMQLSVGGLTPDAEDATNELDWLVLEAQQQIRLPEPLVNLVYHDKLSEDFLLKCVDLIRTGIGQPAFHNSQVVIERHLLHHKMPLEEARTFIICGCVQSAIPGCTDNYWETRFNVAKMIELTMENGKDPLTGNQLGLQTGDVESFTSFDEFYQAFCKQLDYFIRLTHNVSRTAWSLQRNFPTPYGSSLVNDCIEKGIDISDGGARYSFGDGVCFAGVIDVANSLAAIKKLIFEDKKLTMRQLKEAIAADFEGYEEVLRLCLDAPKYGNDDDYADLIAKDIYNIGYDSHSKVDHLGRPVMPSAYSVTAHAAFGEFTGALPNGKKARKPLCDGSISAQSGTDKNGVTALVKSATRVIDTVKYGSSHLNMKFHPVALKGINGARNLLSLIKTYFDLGGYHVQFNCVSGETLRDAQLHPENYKDLVVRVAGFSAFFVTLEKDVQEEIIDRTELMM